MIRSRIPGELITGGDVVMIGDKAFPVLETCLIGMPVLRGSINAVYTSEPRTELTLEQADRIFQFPAKPAKPACFECGEPSTHVWERDYEPKRYLCQPCFQEWTANEERNDERVTEERGL